MHLQLPLPTRSVYEPPPAPEPHDPFDASWARSLEHRVLAPMLDAWFRAEIVGGETLPAEGPVIFASNHSGNAFPYDAIALDALLWRRDGMTDASKMRTVYERELSYVWWMRPFGIDDFWRRGGGVDMTYDNLDFLLRRRDRVLYFPEGVPGIGKGFSKRYQLQPFHTSFVRLAAIHDVPIIPIHIVNAEWIHPFGYTFRGLDRLMQRTFRVPFLPLPLGLAAIVFPWIWYLAFPARLVFVVGTPISARQQLRVAGSESVTAPSDIHVRAAAELIRTRMQHELDAAVAAHGRTRYGARSLAQALRGRPAWWRATPITWPFTFLRHERDRARTPATGRMHSLFRDIDLLAFYVPLGWPLLSLARALRRPPWGHRGVPRSDRPLRDGRYVWRLIERPLPPRADAPSSRAPRA